MHRFATAHLADAVVLRHLKSIRGRERSATAFLIAYIAEAEARRLFLPEACDSMVAFCERELGLSEDEALKRIHAGRVARRFPQVFEMLADGRLSMTSVNVLAPYLTESNADEFLASAAGRSKAEILRLLAARFPKPEPLPLVIAPQERVAEAPSSAPVTSERVPTPAPQPPSVHARVRPHAADRYTAQLAWNQATEDELRECESLLSHRIPPGHRGEVVAYAIHQLVLALRKRKFAATDRPARTSRATQTARHIPAHVRRAVRGRDGDRCTFVSSSGQRCGSRARLEFDHAIPVARGGESSIDNLRLRCRAHNQFAAEQAFGLAFMRAKRGVAPERPAPQNFNAIPHVGTPSRMPNIGCSSA